MTHSENLATLKEKEAAGLYGGPNGNYGDPNGYGGLYNCKEYQENYNTEVITYTADIGQKINRKKIQ